ncbi:hypothetical protein KOR34_02010 [Posidoniimonas corsicana]|uniref:Uncharacterized protein n=2 Tax=Posidoniimonas corsicana TaxID=1938618 RepID=A0A5C5VAH4_9BACT|nr:hypothetical protein KOR34_02010 [Posidoniimonas corsicana]
MLAVFTVDNLNDTGAGSLRDAITMANGSVGLDTVIFDSAVFASAQTIAIASQLPTITDDLTITGPGADLLTIDAGGGGNGIGDLNGYRHFEIDNGVNGADLSVTISGMKLTGGDLGDGGAIRSRENVLLSGLTIDGNASNFGGAINHREGTFTIKNSTLSNNQVNRNGGAIENGGELVIIDSTLSGNTADVNGSGGAITNYGPTGGNAGLVIRNSTITGNSSSGLGDGIFTSNGYGSATVQLDHTIVDNEVWWLSGTLTGNYNLFSGANPGIVGANNLFNSNPLLGRLADNGGPTQTHALLPGSPAINAGDPAINSGTDQRGLDRVQLGRVDIGAYEWQTVLPAQGLEVSTTNDLIDGDFTVGNLSLREAIAIAIATDLPGGNTNPGDDIITFDPDVFTGGANSVIRLRGAELQITETLTIDASSATDVVITADAAGDDTLVPGTFLTDVAASGIGLLDDNSRVFNFSATTGDLTLTGLTLTGGRATGSGGGIRFNGSGTLALIESTLSGNTSHFDGGGIYTRAGGVTLTSSTLSGNTTGYNGRGGGIYAGYGEVTLTNSTLSGNKCDFYGGGIFNFFGGVTLTSSTLSGNTSNNRGGGILTLAGGVTLNSSTLSGNASRFNGGGIYTFEGAVTLTSSTVTNNQASQGAGGGVFVSDTGTNPAITVQNSIIAGNTDSGAAPDLRPDPGSPVSIDHSLIGAAGSVFDPLLGPLADNGGPTQTHALLPGSPAINAGDPALASGFDQRGAPFLRDDGAGVDIGAFELQGVPNFPDGDYNYDGVADAADYTVWRDTLGSTTDLRANGDNTGASAGKIDRADYLLWRANYGNTTVPTTPAPAPAPTPVSAPVAAAGEQPAAEAAFAQWFAPTATAVTSEDDTPVATLPAEPGKDGSLLLLALDRPTSATDDWDETIDRLAEQNEPEPAGEELATLGVVFGEF